MALVPCPECHQSVSTAAASCPHCGRPLTPGAPVVTVQAGPLAAPRVDAGPERELWQGGPSAKALLVVIVGTILLALIVPTVLVVLYGPAKAALGHAIEDPAMRVTARQALRLAFTVIGVVLIAGRVATVAWRLVALKSQRYRVTNQRILIESGVLAKRLEEIDMRTIEDLVFQQGPLERLLGIGAVILVGSDRAAGHRRLSALERPREVRELIRGAAYQATRGQLFTRET